MRIWAEKFHLARTLSPMVAGQLLLRRIRKPWRAWRAARTSAQQIEAVEGDLESVLTIDYELNTFLESKFGALGNLLISQEQRQQVTDLLHQRFPEWVERCLATANTICENRVSVLGHELCLGEPINWHKDYVGGAVWPASHTARLRKIPLNHGCDIKFAWELSRFHHGVTLARAFALTADERFANKFVSQFSHWLESNRPCFGPNWLCAMEVAIRAVNLIWAGSLLASSEAFNLTKERFVKSVLAHGVFIYHNLEYGERVVGSSLRPVNGNHYLADLAGLLYISCVFPECRYASEWRQVAERELFREIRLQVDDEGVHHEYSPNYHRLVLEMILSCLILLERQSVTLPEDIRNKTFKMLEFIRHYRKPSGGIPLVRDIDNGRFCILGDEELTSHDHLLALGAIYFDHPDLYPGRLFEDCLWYLGPRAYEWHNRQPAPSPSPPRQERRLSLPSLHFRSAASKLYRQSGFCVMRHNTHYLLAVCSPKGMQGYCGHTHNDFLSFDLEAYGRTFLTDCGSYVYTQSPEWRNRFRSVMSHNTLTVDGCEQNRFDPKCLFAIDSKVEPEVREWKSSADLDLLEAAYTLELRDGTEATHERRFVFLKAHGLWLIRDRVIGAGQHRIETRFHFAEGTEIASAGDRAYRTLFNPGPNLFLIALGADPTTTQVDQGWVSATYGVKRPIRVLRFIKSIQLPFEQEYILAPTKSDASHKELPVSELEGLRRMASQLVL